MSNTQINRDIVEILTHDKIVQQLGISSKVIAELQDYFKPGKGVQQTWNECASRMCSVDKKHYMKVSRGRYKKI